MDEPNTLRIVLLGKTGTGKSSLANTIFGEDVFEVKHGFDSQASICQARSGSVNGRNLTVIDTPGFVDPGRSEQELKPEIMRCIAACAPGPHVFLIVLKVEKFTEQEKDVVRQMHEYFSAEALKYSAVVFTHGDQLYEDMNIKMFIGDNQHLKDLVDKCGGRCHVVDNRYWKNNQRDEYRSNRFQVEQLLNTIGLITEANKGGCYTTEMLQEWERQQEKKHVRPSSASFLSILKCLMNCATNKFVGVFLGVAAIVGGLHLSKRCTKDQTEAGPGEKTHAFL